MAKKPYCTFCEKAGHTAFTCTLKPRRPITAKKQLRGKRRLRKIGKVGRQWIATRKEWIAKNLPDSGVWNCTYCGVPLHLNELTLDHAKSRSRHPELRYELDNLVPACWDCNTRKGSRDLEELEVNHEAN